MRPRTDRQTDTQTRVTVIHFASSTTHAKCNDRPYLLSVLYVFVFYICVVFSFTSFNALLTFDEY